MNEKLHSNKRERILIAHMSDWHIGKILNEHNLLEDQKFILNELVQRLIEKHTDVLMISGDIFDRSSPSAESVSLVDEILSKIVSSGINVMIIAGNHDSRERVSFLNSLYEKSGLYVEGLIKTEIKKVVLNDIHGNVNFYFLPYVEPNSARMVYPEADIKTYDSAVEAVTEKMLKELNKSERNILLAHGYFNYIKNEKVKSDGIIFSESEISLGGADLVDISRFEDFDYIALGHLHSPQKIGKEHIRYSGSLLKYSVSEADTNKSVTFVEIKEKGNINIYEESLAPLRDLKIIENSFEYITNKENFNGFNFDDFIFAVLTDSEPIIDCAIKLRNIFPKLLGVKYKTPSENFDISINSSDTIKQKSHIELFSNFYSAITGEKAPEDKIEIIKDIFIKISEGGE